MASPPKRVRFASTTSVAPSPPPSPTYSTSSSDNDSTDVFEMKFDFTKFFLMFDLESDVAKYLVDLDLDRFVTNLELVIINSRRLRSRRSAVNGSLPLSHRLTLQQSVLKARQVLMQDIESLEAVFKRMERRGLPGALELRDNIRMAREFIDRVTVTRSDTDTEDERRASHHDEARRRSVAIPQRDISGQANRGERPPSDPARQSRTTVYVQHSPPAPFPTTPRHAHHYYVPISQSVPTTLQQTISQPEPRSRRATMPTSHSKEYYQQHLHHIGGHRHSDTIASHQLLTPSVSSPKPKRSSFPTSPRPDPHEWFQARSHPAAQAAPSTSYV